MKWIFGAGKRAILPQMEPLNHISTLLHVKSASNQLFRLLPSFSRWNFLIIIPLHLPIICPLVTNCIGWALIGIPQRKCINHRKTQKVSTFVYTVSSNISENIFEWVYLQCKMVCSTLASHLSAQLKYKVRV